MRQIALDTETTGLDPSLGHRVIEIGAVEIVDRTLTGKRLHVYLNPERDLDPDVVKVHGLTYGFLCDKPKFGEIASDFIDFIIGAELIMHNASFDARFLDAELERIGEMPLRYYCAGIIDTLKLASQFFPRKKKSLDALCGYYGIDNTARKQHGALLDATLLAKVYLAMTQAQEVLPLFSTSPQGPEAEKTPEDTPAPLDAQNVHSSPARKRPSRSFRIFRPTPEELAAHEAYLLELSEEAGIRPAIRW